MTALCQQDDRRDAVRRRVAWNGLDYVELGVNERILRAYFLGKLPSELAAAKPGLADYLRIEGGVRITDLRILDVQPIVDPDPAHDDHLVIRIDRVGDFSPYTLRLVGVENVDPHYVSTQFRFRIDCPADIDCTPICDCPPSTPDEPEINYLAKDYASFRQLILDRLALVMPDWRERHVPDLGITLVEVLAYAGDMLSYYQDSVATEATLDTARLRISVRRHARLVDYTLHEGCNARAVICFQVDNAVTLDPARVAFVSGLGDGPSVLGWDDLREFSADRYEVFEPVVAGRLDAIHFLPPHNAIRFHDFGGRLCCLERGSVSAALVDRGLALAAGDLLVLEEVLGARTGLPQDADPQRRHVVRLTGVTAHEDPIVRGADDTPTRYLDVTWDAADALPFPLCLSAIGSPPDCAYLDSVSVARGNVLVVDHGRTTGPEELGVVPAVATQADCDCAGEPGPSETMPGRYEPALARVPLTWCEPLDPTAPAATLAVQDCRRAAPALSLTSAPPLPWATRPDLMGSHGSDPSVVVETDNDGVAHVRFGDGALGLRPAALTQFAATYRVGNGPAGNVGANTITRMVLRDGTLDGVAITLRNPLAAGGGTAPETIAQAKLLAPFAFRRKLARAIIADDYASLAQRDLRVQRAAARLVWNGSWYEADVGVDPLASEDAPAALLEDIAAGLEPFRRVGHDLQVRAARYVPLDLRIEACAQSYFRHGDVKAALLAAFGTRRLADGTLGLFHPDALSFGQGVFVSRLIARAQAIPGVASVAVTKLERLFEGPNGEVAAGVLSLGAAEIAQLDGDSNRPERGKLEIVLRGGR